MKTDVLIIGAGQAGLAMGYFLKQKKVSFAILGKESRIGEVWRNRYDSLLLFTPRWFSSLPGMVLKGNKKTYAGKDEIADYLEAYAQKFHLPVRLNVEVLSLVKAGDDFIAKTTKGDYTARNIIIATGPFQKAAVPAFSHQLSDHIYQAHTSGYQNPGQLQDGPVLVIGGGNSGAQIAVELSETREVYLSVGHKITFLPLQVLGKSIFWWFQKAGLYRYTKNTGIGKRIMSQGDPIMGRNLKSLIRKGKIKLKPRALKAGSGTLSFADEFQLEVQRVSFSPHL